MGNSPLKDQTIGGHPVRTATILGIIVLFVVSSHAHDSTSMDVPSYEGGLCVRLLRHLRLIETPAKNQILSPEGGAARHKDEKNDKIISHTEDKINLADADYVMGVASVEAKRLKALPLKEREMVQIPFFKSEIPWVKEIIKSVPSSVDTRPYFLIDENGNKKHNGETVGQVKAYLLAEAEKRYTENTATLSWFPEFALDVIALRNSVQESIIPIDKIDFEVRQKESGPGKKQNPEVSFYIELTAAKSSLISQRHRGTIHWPNFAKLKIQHFDNWDQNLKPIGISEDLYVDFDGDTHTSFYLIFHDIFSHDIPTEFIPFQRDFRSFKQSVSGQFKFEAQIRKEIEKFIWFEATHELGSMYSVFALFKLEGLTPDQAVSEFAKRMSYSLLGSSQEPSQLMQRLRDPKDYGAEVSPELNLLSDSTLTREVLLTWNKTMISIRRAFALQKK